MADTKVTNMTAIAAGAMNATDELYVNVGGLDRKVAFDDMYIGGTTTLTWGGATTDGTVNETSNTCQYQRVGKFVQFTAYITWDATGFVAPTGQLYIRGLPIAAISGGYAAITFANATGVTVAAGEVIGAYVESANTYMKMKSYEGLSPTTIDGSDLSTAGSIMISGHYAVA